MINSASPPESLYDKFDPVDTSNWLFFPGAEIKVNTYHVDCHCEYLFEESIICKLIDRI